MNFFRILLNSVAHRPVIIALIAGAIFPLSLAPYNLWPAALISVGLLFQLSKDLPAKQAAWIGYIYGLGFFGTGVSWVYVSIHDFGGANSALSGFLTLLFTAGLALFFALQTHFLRIVTGPLEKLSQGPKQLLLAPVFAAVWVLFEWLRSWLLSGFPWLYAGYATLENPLAGWAPVVGVYGASLAIVISAVALSYLIPEFIARGLAEKIPTPDDSESTQQDASVEPDQDVSDSSAQIPSPSPALKPVWLCIAILPWLAGYGLQQITWVSPEADAADIKVALVQGNIAQQEKWKPRNLPAIMQLYQQATVELPPQDIIVWPESAIPQFLHNLEPFTQKVIQQLPEKTVLITGLLEAVATESKDGEQEYKIHNVILTSQQNQPDQIYRKRKLVPFGEYVPLENYLRGLIGLFDLPMSKFASGDAQQPLLVAGYLNIMGLVCYEIAYPELARQKPSDLILTISNDSWFGNSIGPLQHLQMAQFRALEIGRYLVRGTNNGISAIVDEKGRILAQTKQFKFQVLTGHVKKMRGETPYFRYGSSPVLFLCLGIVLSVLVSRFTRSGK